MKPSHRKEDVVGSVKKWRKKRMSKHKHRKRLKRQRWQRRKRR
jgi:hypothetical protein